MLAARGARTLGVDLQPSFVEYARSRAGSTEDYRTGDIQLLSEVSDGLFDLAVSYISLVDVPDQRAVIGEAFRVLSPGGRFVVCNLSPMATLPPNSPGCLRTRICSGCRSSPSTTWPSSRADSRPGSTPGRRRCSRVAALWAREAHVRRRSTRSPVRARADQPRTDATQTWPSAENTTRSAPTAARSPSG